MSNVIHVEFDPIEGRCWECGRKATRYVNGALGCDRCFPGAEPYDPTPKEAS